MRYRDMTPEQKELFHARIKKYKAEHTDEARDRYKKYRAEHRDEINERHKKYRAEHPEYRAKSRERTKKYCSEHREERKKYYDDHKAERRLRMSKYQSENVNSKGRTKSSIRAQSNRILFKTHTKIPSYEIHHCFTYDDPNRFIYIPRSLHLRIHQLLREKNVPADSDHWNIIRELANGCEEYTYIRC